MPGDGHLARGGSPTLGDPAGTALGAAHHEPGVVRPHRPRTDEDRVAARPQGVHPVEVGRGAQHEPLPRPVVEVAVERRGAAQHGVGALSHGRSRPPRRRPTGTRRLGAGRCRAASSESAFATGRRGAHRSWQGRDEHDRPVGDRHGQSLPGTEPCRSERPRRGSLTWPPARQVEWYRRTSSTSRAMGRSSTTGSRRRQPGPR